MRLNSFRYVAPLAFLLALTLRAAEPTTAETPTPATPLTKTGAATPATMPKGKAFKKVSDEMDTAMQADSAAAEKGALSFKQGHGLRILMTGHSWVAPGKITLPDIAKAAGYKDHVQRDHTSGGASGSANSIWLNEHGQGAKTPYRTILLPAIETGQWDVMTWGMYNNDTVENYTQWMEICLKQNPAMVFYIQDGWPTPRFGKKNVSQAELVVALKEMYASTMMPMFKGNLDALNQAYPDKVHIIPAGAAVVEMIEYFAAGELPGFDCIAEIDGGKRGIFSPDSFHLSRTSGIGWLVGYCYYGTLYKKSPELIENFKPTGVDPKVDALMRKAAWHAIVNSPFSGLTDANHNGIADEIEAKATATTK